MIIEKMATISDRENIKVALDLPSITDVAMPVEIRTGIRVLNIV